MSAPEFTIEQAHAACYGVALCLKVMDLPEPMKRPGQIALGHQASSVGWNQLSDEAQVRAGFLLGQFKVDDEAPFTCYTREDGTDALRLQYRPDDVCPLATVLMAIISLAAGSETWESLFDAMPLGEAIRSRAMLASAHFIPLN